MIVISECDRCRVWSFKQQYLYILRPHGTHAGDTQDETYRVEDVGLSTAVEAGDGIEALVPTTDNCTNGIRLEAVNDNLYDSHLGDV